MRQTEGEREQGREKESGGERGRREGMRERFCLFYVLDVVV